VIEETPVEAFPALLAVEGIAHGFTGRAPGIEVQVDRPLALQRLDEAHAAARVRLGIAAKSFITAEQVHGSDVAVVSAETPSPVSATDGLITADPNVCLGIYVADCGPVFLVEPECRVIALLHSGRKGTELGIVNVAIERMVRVFRCDPARMIVQLGPCIRPPHYEIDFAAAILARARAAGVPQVHDCGACTAAARDRYYSYRMEQGKTGRMLALLALQ